MLILTIYIADFYGVFFFFIEWYILLLIFFYWIEGVSIKEYHIKPYKIPSLFHRGLVTISLQGTVVRLKKIEISRPESNIRTNKISAPSRNRIHDH